MNKDMKRLPITKENVEARFKPVLNDSNLWNLIRKIKANDEYDKGKQQEDKFIEADLGFISLKKAMNDENYYFDSSLGDFYDSKFGVNIDLKISETKPFACSISDTSLKNFSGWYLCCSPNGEKAYFMNAVYLAKKLATKELKENKKGHFYGETNYYSLVDDENIFVINRDEPVSLF